MLLVLIGKVMFFFFNRIFCVELCILKKGYENILLELNDVGIK